MMLSSAIVSDVEADNEGLAGIVFDGAQVSGSAPSGGPIKAGILMAGDFSGTPKIAAVTFETPFTDSNYAVVITGEDARAFTYSGKSGDGFTVHANANGAFTSEVSWIAIPTGET